MKLLLLTMFFAVVVAILAIITCDSLVIIAACLCGVAVGIALED